MSGRSFAYESRQIEEWRRNNCALVNGRYGEHSYMLHPVSIKFGGLGGRLVRGPEAVVKTQIGKKLSEARRLTLSTFSRKSSNRRSNPVPVFRPRAVFTSGKRSDF